MIPDLDDFAVREAENIHTGERCSLPSCRYRSPLTQVSSSRGPTGGDEVSIRQHQVNVESQIGKRTPKVGGDLCLTGGARFSLRRPQVVPDVVLREHFLREADVPVVPDLLVK